MPKDRWFTGVADVIVLLARPVLYNTARCVDSRVEIQNKSLDSALQRRAQVSFWFSLVRMPWLLVGIVLIFLLDTLTHYEVAVAVFYAVLILAAGRTLSHHQIVKLACLCVGLTVLSVLLTPSGNLATGIVNTTISVVAIALIVTVHGKMDIARRQAQKAQQQIARLTRIQSLEGLSSSIAHEINQPLAAMLTSAQTCQRWLAQDPPNTDKARQSAERIVHDAQRASAIITRVRSLTQGGAVQAHAFDLNMAIQEVLGLLQTELHAHSILVQSSLLPNLPSAWGDKVYVQQVLSNLFLNAMEAMEQVPPQFRVLQLGTRLDDNMLLLTVGDKGPGLQPGQEEQIFETFWTTKPQGMGLGLSISRSMVEALGGQLWASNQIEGGAVFCLSLPPADTEEK